MRVPSDWCAWHYHTGNGGSTGKPPGEQWLKVAKTVPCSLADQPLERPSPHTPHHQSTQPQQIALQTFTMASPLVLLALCCMQPLPSSAGDSTVNQLEQILDFVGTPSDEEIQAMGASPAAQVIPALSP